MKRRILWTALAAMAAIVVIAAGLLAWFLSGDGSRRALEQQATAWLGQPVHIGAVSAHLLPRVSVHLTDVRAGEPVRLTLAEVTLSTDLRALLGRRIENAEVVVSGSRIEMPLPFTLPGSAPPIRPATAGEPAAAAPADPAAATGSATAALRLVSVRSIALRDVRLVSRGREIVVSADSSLNGSELQLQRFTAASKRSRFEASGVVQLTPRVDGRLKIIANELDADALLALAAAFAPAASSGSGGASPGALPMRLAARISSERARAGGVDLQQFATDFQVEGTTVALSPMTFQLFGGRYQGSLNATLGNAITATWRARVTDLDVAQLAAHGGVADTVTGKLSGAAAISGQGADFAAVLKSARGSGTATIVNGSISRLNLIRTVVLFFGRPDPGASGSGDAFERLDARFTLASKVLQAQALSLHSLDVDMAGSGTLNLETEALDGELDLSLSEALSAQAGTDLIRFTREGNRVVLPARIFGTLSQPRLNIDAAAAAQRGLRNEVDRRLKGLLDRFSRP